MKPIYSSVHTLGYVERRGFTAQEFEEIIRTCAWQPAERGKLECRKDYPFNAEWNGKKYATRQVRPIFADEPNAIVVVTVYTCCF